MRTSRALIRLFVAAWLAFSAAYCAAQPAAATHATQALNLGVSTHYSQGWPASSWPLVTAIHAATIRDSLHWRQIEQTPGHYIFTAQNSGHVQSACKAGVGVVLVIDPRSAIYDNGQTAFSPVARTAFANYLNAIADRFGKCVQAIELGNEINGKNNITGAAAEDRVAAYTALLKQVYLQVKPGHPQLQILGGSTNVIGTGFLVQLFKAGALAFMDGVVVHPYRPQPENVDWELAHLDSEMDKYGGRKPIWATEFSNNFASPAEAPGFLVKMATLMNAAGITQAQWYALKEESYFPTMGLFIGERDPKPVARAFTYLMTQVLPYGKATRVDEHDPNIFHYRFGNDRQIIWGAPRSLHLDPAAPVHNAQGEQISIPAQTSDQPIIIAGSTRVTLGPVMTLADSLFGFDKSPWQYFVEEKSGQPSPLSPVDWNWGSYLGNAKHPAVFVTPLGIAPGNAAGIMLRYTALVATHARALVCLSNAKQHGVGMHFQLLQNGVMRSEGVVGVGDYAAETSVNLAAHETLDFIVRPSGVSSGRFINYHFRVVTGQQQGSACDITNMSKIVQ